MSALFATVAGLLTFCLAWVIIVFALGYLAGRIQLLRLLVFVQPFKTVAAAVAFTTAVALGVWVFQALA